MEEAVLQRYAEEARVWGGVSPSNGYGFGRDLGPFPEN